MHYPIAIERGNKNTAYGVVVPDLPGCFSAGDTLDQAIANATEAAVAWIDATLDDGGFVPPPSTLDNISRNPAYKDWSFGAINVDPAAFESETERVNITLPRRVLMRLDAQAKAVQETRSGYIAKMTILGFRPAMPQTKSEEAARKPAPKIVKHKITERLRKRA